MIVVMDKGYAMKPGEQPAQRPAPGQPLRLSRTLLTWRRSLAEFAPKLFR